jgi:AcrR family transcriptional regulator
MSPTRRGLLAGAAQAFARSGLRRSTMQSVAVAAGVAKATLYNHFRTKDEVARALLALELERLVATAAALPAAEALAVLSDELGAHPVLRRLVETEPEALVAFLAGGSWGRLIGSLAAALDVGEDAAELAGRWLLGVVLQPGRSSTRHRHARLLAAAIAGGAAVRPGAATG